MRTLSVRTAAWFVLLLATDGYPQDDSGKQQECPSPDAKMPVMRAEPLFAKLQGDVIQSLAFSPDARLLAVGGGAFDRAHIGPGYVNLWDIKAGTAVSLFEAHPFMSKWLVFSLDGKTLASAGDSLTLILWDVASRKRRRDSSPDGEGGKEDPHDYVWGVTFSADSRLLAWAERSRIEWRDLLTGKGLPSPAIPGKHHVTGFFFSPESDLLALLEEDRTARAPMKSGQLTLWDCSKGREKWSRTVPPSNRFVSVSSDGSRLAVARSHMDYKSNRYHAFSRVLVLQTDSGKEIADFRPNQHTTPQGPPDCGTMSPNGRFFVLGSGCSTTGGIGGGIVAVWDLQQCREITAFVAHADDVEAVAFSADGKFLATAGADRYVKIWDFGRLLPVERLDANSSKPR